jgi:hypothetical protein
VQGGSGCIIALKAGSLQSAIGVGSHLNIAAFGVSGAKGGAFALTAPSIDISQGSKDWTQA